MPSTNTIITKSQPHLSYQNAAHMQDICDFGSIWSKVRERNIVSATCYLGKRHITWTWAEKLTLMLTSTHCWQNICLHRSNIVFFSRTLQTGQLMRLERYFTCSVIWSMVYADTPLLPDFPADATAFIAVSSASFFTTASDSIICFFSSSFLLDSVTRSSHRALAVSRSLVIEAAFSLDCARRPSMWSFSLRRDSHSFCSCFTVSSRIYSNKTEQAGKRRDEFTPVHGDYWWWKSMTGDLTYLFFSQGLLTNSILSIGR